jgi:DNA polymerase-3 subunit beta
MVAAVEKKAGSGKDAQEAPKEERKAGAKVELFRAAAGDVVKALQKISGAGGRSRTMAILTHVLIVKDGAKVRFTASDLEEQLSVEAELGGSPGKATVTAELRKLMDILKALQADVMVSMVSDGVKSTITAGRSKFTVAWLEASDFPLMTEAAYDCAVVLKQGVLRNMIDDVSYSMAVADIRYYLNGMLLETDETTVYAVATDGHRLAMSEARTEKTMDKRSIILPRKVVGEMAKLLSDGAEDVELRLASSQACLTIGDVKMVTKLVEGKFPDYRRVIPQRVKESVTFDRVELASALRRAALMTSERFKGVRLGFDASELRLNVENDSGESASEVVAIEYAGEKLEMGMNVNLLAEAVENLACEKVTLGVRTGADSILITSPSNANFRAVVMPMRI